MNTTLMVILNRGSEDDSCRLFLPYWQRSGCDILFSSPEDDPSKLAKQMHWVTGRSYNTRDINSFWLYQQRVLDTMKAVVRIPYYTFVFTQYDSICLGTLPKLSSTDCIHHKFGNNDPNYRASFYTHPPWCFGKIRLAEFIDATSRHSITAEHGVMDRWMAWVMEESGIQVEPSNSWSWSANAIDTPGHVAECRTAIANGAIFIHGVKNKAQLDQILG